MSEQDYEQLMLFPVDSLVSHSVWLESKKEKGTTVTSGRRCSELSENLRRVGLSVRTYLESCALPLPTLSRTWSVKAMTWSCLILKLRLSERRTEENASRLWATPNTMDHLPQRSEEALLRQARGAWKCHTRPSNLREQVDERTMKLFQTMTANDAKNSTFPPSQMNRNGGLIKSLMATPQARDYRTGSISRWNDPNRSRNLNDQIGGQLNPTWVEWLMGFPIGWTDLDA